MNTHYFTEREIKIDIANDESFIINFRNVKNETRPIDIKKDNILICDLKIKVIK